MPSVCARACCYTSRFTSLSRAGVLAVVEITELIRTDAGTTRVSMAVD